VRFFLRRLFRRTFFLGAFRKLRELVLRPYAHRLLARAAAQRGAAFTVLQIGANDGVSLDPLSSLVRKHRWSGVLVEPNPVNFEKLQHTYADHPQIRLERAAITTHDGTVTLYRPLDLPDGSKSPLHGSDTLDLNVTSKLAWVSEDWRSMMEPVEVPAMRLATLLEKHGLTEIDFLLTDTEGHDKIILDQVDLETLRPRFIQFEFIHIPQADLQELKARLRRHGYRLLPLRWDIFAYQSRP
jgi:FkbM family methyltransferase